MEGEGRRALLPGLSLQGVGKWGSREGPGAQSGGCGFTWASGFQPGGPGTVVRKAPEEARQQRCGQGPGDLGRFWKGQEGGGEGKEGQGGGKRPRSRDKPFLTLWWAPGSGAPECRRQHLPRGHGYSR